MTDQPKIKLFQVQVLLPEALNWTSLSIIAESHWVARQCAEHYGIVGLAFEVPDGLQINPPIDDLVADITPENRHPEFPLTDYETTMPFAPSDPDWAYGIGFIPITPVDWSFLKRPRWDWLKAIRFQDVIVLVIILIIGYMIL
jgi:hypothetical protein